MDRRVNMEFKEGKLNHPIGEIIPGPFGEIDGRKPQQPADKKKEEKKEPTLITKKEKI